MPDKYAALWLSHSSIRDFQQCPRSYYLNNVYKDPQNNKKIQLISPPLTLGSAVHQIIEHLSDLPVANRFSTSLVDLFEKAWSNYSGLKGGFTDQTTEERYKERGRAMLRTVMRNPGPLANKAIKVQEDLPQYWFSEADEMILCGKIDWLEYLPATDSVHIIDFKTGKNNDDGSLQLPIYLLLVSHVQKRKVAGASYWYLESGSELTAQKLPQIDEAYELVMSLAKQIKLAKKLNRFKCPRGEIGCKYCRPLEKIIAGEATFVGQGEYGKNCYIFPKDQVKEAKLL